MPFALFMFYIVEAHGETHEMWYSGLLVAGCEQMLPGSTRENSNILTPVGFGVQRNQTWIRIVQFPWKKPDEFNIIIIILCPKSHNPNKKQKKYY